MNIQEHLKFWNQASINIIDIRHKFMECGEELRGYRLPVSVFLYAARGKAQLWIDESPHTANRFYVLHGSKGTCLDIIAVEPFEYYLIMYKAVLPLPIGRDLLKLTEQHNPFQIQFGCVPLYPISLLDKVKKMLEEWTEPEHMELFHVKALFYQFVYELMWQLHRQGGQAVKPDLISQAIRYMLEHYQEPVTMENMAETLGCSARYLTRIFNRQLNESPMHILTEIRMDKAAQWLMDTNATLQEIAESVGYANGYSLSRVFKKYYEESPERYKKLYTKGKQVPKRVWHSSWTDIARKSRTDYSEMVNENHYHYRGEGNLAMPTYSKPPVLAVMLLIFTLLLSACNGSPVTGNREEISTPTSKTAATTVPTVDQQTRIYTDAKGRKVEIPVSPQRIVTTYHLGELVALGVRPVGAFPYTLETHPFINVDGIEGIGIPPNLEKMVELKPDLIIAGDNFWDKNEDFSKIAPTVYVPHVASIETFGELLGKQEEAEQWTSTFEQKLKLSSEKIKKALGEGQTISIINIRAKNFYVYGVGNMGGSLVYDMLQLPATDRVQQDVLDGEVWEISKEVIPEYVGDHILLIIHKVDGGEEMAKELMASPLWQNIPAVQKNQVYEVEFDDFFWTDPISLDHQLDILVDVIPAKK